MPSFNDLTKSEHEIEAAFEALREQINKIVENEPGELLWKHATYIPAWKDPKWKKAKVFFEHEGRPLTGKAAIICEGYCWFIAFEDNYTKALILMPKTDKVEFLEE